jgi:mannose-1-phosphate guanylyltransferase
LKAFLLAAGFGTRLRPLTYLDPKPMLPVANKPIIGWVVEQAMAAGIRDFVVNLHHLPGAIESYLPAAFPDARFEFSVEDEILGTGGTLRRARPMLEGEEAFFLINGDTIQSPPFERLREAREAENALAALALRHPPAGDRFTAVWYEAPQPGNPATPRPGFITGFGSGHGEPLMFSGAHCLSRQVLDLLPDRPFSGIVEDVYIPAAPVLAGVLHDDPLWFDIGTPQRYLAATLALLGTRHSALGTASGAVVGQGSVVEGTLIDSVVWDGCHIAAGVRLTRCIVGHNVELRSGEYTDAMICHDHPSIPAEYPREGGVVVARF